MVRTRASANRSHEVPTVKCSARGVLAGLKETRSPSVRRAALTACAARCHGGRRGGALGEAAAGAVLARARIGGELPLGCDEGKLRAFELSACALIGLPKPEPTFEPFEPLLLWALWLLWPRFNEASLFLKEEVFMCERDESSEAKSVLSTASIASSGKPGSSCVAGGLWPKPVERESSGDTPSSSTISRSSVRPCKVEENETRTIVRRTRERFKPWCKRTGWA
eukprot:232838-Pleurochrysis_carterae.AAC.6